MLEKLKTISELFNFFARQKRWFLIPMLLVFLLFGFLLLFLGSSPLAPIVYPLF